MDFTKYKNKLPHRLAEDSPLYVQRKAAKEALDVAEAALRAEVNKVREEHRQETYRLEAQFQADALKELELDGNSKAQKAFEKAWEQSHSEGLEAVFNTLQDLAELVR